MAKYALKIRKSDLPLLAILNGGCEPKVEKAETYLIVDTDGPNQIVSKKTFDKLDLLWNSPRLFKLKK